MNQEKLHNLRKEQQPNICQIVAYKNNQKVYSDCWNNYSKNDCTHIMSVTKSIISLLVGIALDKGQIKSIDDKVYFVSGTGGNCTIFEATADTFDVIREIPVAPEIGGMVQITKIEDYFYITVSTSLYGEPELRDIIRTDSLEHLQVGQYESLYERLIGEFPGTPYNITHVDGKWCLTVHREGLGSPVVYFEVKDNEIVNVGTYY